MKYYYRYRWMILFIITLLIVAFSLRDLILYDAPLWIIAAILLTFGGLLIMSAWLKEKVRFFIHSTVLVLFLVLCIILVRSYQTLDNIPIHENLLGIWKSEEGYRLEFEGDSLKIFSDQNDSLIISYGYRHKRRNNILTLINSTDTLHLEAIYSGDDLYLESDEFEFNLKRQK